MEGVSSIELEKRIQQLEAENKTLLDQMKNSLKQNRHDLNLYKYLFLEAIEGIVFWQGEGTIIDANEAACRIFETEYQDLIRMNLQDFIYKKNDEFNKIIWSLLHYHEVREELFFLMPNNQKKLLEFTIKLHVKDDYNIAIFRNVSERYRMEESLRKSEEKFRGIFEGVSENILLCNDSLVILDINKSCLSFIKKPKEALIGKSLFYFFEICGINDKESQYNLSSFLDHNHESQIVKLQLEDGKTKYLEFRSDYHVFSDLNLLTFIDITEKYVMEDQLRKSDTLHVIGELAAGIAHEIRNPLTSIKGFIQLLEDNIKDYSVYFNVILSELMRIDSIINEFLILAKPQEVKFSYNDIKQIILETVELLNAQAVLFDVQFQTSFPKDLPMIYCERNQLKKVFINLIKNAIEVMMSGGLITISIVEEKEKQIRISVEDQGCGIPEDKLKRLGEPFYTTKERGTGLGLMVSYKIVKEHNGYIEVESELNKGTIFHIYLPIHAKKNRPGT
ncbi:PAS domain-containing protein [Bacillaceae bacterium Marseille-Q3522]|nr:PAS domain-containing protein [Bacillaceae bacterium Marseille-Q3522]